MIKFFLSNEEVYYSVISPWTYPRGNPNLEGYDKGFWCRLIYTENGESLLQKNRIFGGGICSHRFKELKVKRVL